MILFFAGTVLYLALLRILKSLASRVEIYAQHAVSFNVTNKLDAALGLYCMLILFANICFTF